jgi:hypothetical protein
LLPAPPRDPLPFASPFPAATQPVINSNQLLTFLTFLTRASPAILTIIASSNNHPSPFITLPIHRNPCPPTFSIHSLQAIPKSKSNTNPSPQPMAEPKLFTASLHKPITSNPSPAQSQQPSHAIQP